MTSKKFDAASGEYGDHGEAAVRQWLRSQGYTATKHPHGIYGEDIEFASPRERFYLSVERATSSRWSGDSWFPYPTIHVLARRKVESETVYFTLSSDMTKAYVSFADDLSCVTPIKMNNRHCTGEEVRDHEILRCLPVELTKPIDGSLAKMNADRVRKIATESENWSEVTRTLRGRPPYSFGCPYGMDDEEWRELIVSVEERARLQSHLKGARFRDPQKMLAFG